VISAGEVGAIFTIKDDASGALSRLAGEFDKLQGSIDNIKKSLESMGGAMGGPIDKLREQLGLTAEKGDAAAKSIKDAFELNIGSAVDGAKSKLAELRASFDETASKAREETWGNLGGPGGGGRRGGGGGEEEPHEGGHGGRSHFMQHLQSHGGLMGGLGADLIGGPTGAMIGGGMVGYEGFKQSFSVQEAENNMRVAGVTDPKIAEADAIAGNYAKYGMSKLDALEAIRLGMVPLNRLGGSKDEGVDAAMGILPKIAEFHQIAGAMKGEEGGGEATKQLFELFKSDALRNKLSPAEAHKFIDDYEQVYMGTSGKVDPKTFYQGLKYSKSAGMNFSDDFVKYYLPGIETEEGGSTAGTMLMTTASALQGRRMKKPALAELEEMGIYDKNKQLVDADLQLQNPFEWFQKDMMPAMLKAGFDTKDKQMEFLERIFNRNAAETGALLGINPGNVERTAQSIKQTDTGAQASAAIFANDPMAAARAVEASMANLASNLGQSVPGITGGLNNLAGALDWVAHINDNPTFKAR
jgi:hypothetical protein